MIMSSMTHEGFLPPESITARREKDDDSAVRGVRPAHAAYTDANSYEDPRLGY